MSDEPFYSPTLKPAPPRLPKPGELLLEFHVEATHKFYPVELRDHGAYGVEAQILDPVDPVICRTFRADMNPMRTPREMAIAWPRKSGRPYMDKAAFNALLAKRDAIESILGGIEVWVLVFGVFVVIGVAGETVFGVRAWWNNKKLQAVNVEIEQAREEEIARLNKLTEDERLARVRIEERLVPRRTSFDAAAFRAGLKGAANTPAQVEVWYKPEDEEANSFARELVMQLGFAGWHPTEPPVPIPSNAIGESVARLPPAEQKQLSALARIGASPTGVSLFSKEFESSAANTLIEALVAAHVRQPWRSADSRLPEQTIRLIVGEKQ